MLKVPLYRITSYNVCYTKLLRTRREFDLLCYFILNKGLTLSREQILNGVWGYDYDGDIRTVDTHIKQLRIKLLDKAEYINTIHRVGYVITSYSIHYTKLYEKLLAKATVLFQDLH